MRSIPWQLELVGLVLVAAVVLVSSRVRAVDNKPKSEFAQATIDVGCFVSDPHKSVKFYTELLGFREASAFSVPGDFCKKAGLTDGAPLDNIRVVVLDEGPTATKVKFSSVPKHQAKTSDNKFVPSQYGFRYLTIHYANQAPTLERLKKAGVNPVADGPVALPTSTGKEVFLTVVRDPDGNLIELIGPRE